jgi:hypothetical protein
MLPAAAAGPDTTAAAAVAPDAAANVAGVHTLLLLLLLLSLPYLPICVLLPILHPATCAAAAPCFTTPAADLPRLLLLLMICLRCS